MRQKDKENYLFVTLILFVLVFMFIINNYIFPVAQKEQSNLNDYLNIPISLIMSGQPYILPQDDKHIISYIWSNNYVRPPSKLQYNLNNITEDPSRGQAQFIRKILKNTTKGFFVECGALDGETRSNTLFLEMQLQWSGLLVEGDPKNFALMEKKNRKAWLSNTCLAIKPYPHTATFRQSFNTGKVLKANDIFTTNHVTVQCMPLFSLLTAINVTTVDYFSLDVEGNELQVLKTIPFSKLYIKTLSVEYIHTEEGKKEIIKFMQSKDYIIAGEVHYANGLANDIIFMHKDVQFDTNYIYA